MGGTFDPVHLAHITLPSAARAASGMGDACLLFVPAARSPFKADRPRTGDEHRVSMLRLAIRDVPHAAVWTDEIDRAARTNAPSYTIDSLERLRAATQSAAEIRLLIGADQAASFHKWREPRTIIRLAPPLVMLRGSDADSLATMLRAAGFWTQPELEQWAASVVPTPLSPISSTRIRELLASSDPVNEAELVAGLDPAVLGYIRAHRLYRR